MRPGLYNYTHILSALINTFRVAPVRIATKDMDKGDPKVWSRHAIAVNRHGQLVPASHQTACAWSVKGALLSLIDHFESTGHYVTPDGQCVDGYGLMTDAEIFFGMGLDEWNKRQESVDDVIAGLKQLQLHYNHTGKRLAP